MNYNNPHQGYINQNQMFGNNQQQQMQQQQMQQQQVGQIAQQMQLIQQSSGRAHPSQIMQQCSTLLQSAQNLSRTISTQQLAQQLNQIIQHITHHMQQVQNQMQYGGQQQYGQQPYNMFGVGNSYGGNVGIGMQQNQMFAPTQITQRPQLDQEAVYDRFSIDTNKPATKQEVNKPTFSGPGEFKMPMNRPNMLQGFENHNTVVEEESSEIAIFDVKNVVHKLTNKSKLELDVITKPLTKNDIHTEDSNSVVMVENLITASETLRERYKSKDIEKVVRVCDLDISNMFYNTTVKADVEVLLSKPPKTLARELRKRYVNVEDVNDYIVYECLNNILTERLNTILVTEGIVDVSIDNFYSDFDDLLTHLTSSISVEVCGEIEDELNQFILSMSEETKRIVCEDDTTFGIAYPIIGIMVDKHSIELGLDKLGEGLHRLGESEQTGFLRSISIRTDSNSVLVTKEGAVFEYLVSSDRSLIHILRLK